MQEMDTRSLDALQKAFERVLHEFPEKRRSLFERMSGVLKRELDTRTPTRTGRLKSWQQPVVGSGGGYAAIRPVSTSTGARSPGAITNYVESGHDIRRPKGGAKRRYKGRIKTMRVDGRHFYHATRGALTDLFAGEVEAFRNELVEALEGRNAAT